MSDETYRCQRCKTPIQGDSVYCVLCYSKLYRPCPNCMVRGTDGRYRVKKDAEKAQREKRPPRPMDCSHCNNERYVLAED